MEYLVWKAQNRQTVLFPAPSSVGLFSQPPPNMFLQSAFRRSVKKEDSETRPQVQIKNYTGQPETKSCQTWLPGLELSASNLD